MRVATEAVTTNRRSWQGLGHRRHREARMLGAGGAVQHRETRVDGSMGMPEYRGNLHRVHHAWISRQFMPFMNQPPGSVLFERGIDLWPRDASFEAI